MISMGRYSDTMWVLHLLGMLCCAAIAVILVFACIEAAHPRVRLDPMRIMLTLFFAGSIGMLGWTGICLIFWP